MMARWAALAVVMPLTCGPSVALGVTSMSDLPPEQQKRARTLLLGAKEAFENGDYETALGMLEEVYVVYPNPRVLKRMGEAHQNLGNNRLALEHYERFVTEASDDKDVPEVEGKISYLTKLLAEAASMLSVKTDPPGASVVVRTADGEVARGVSPLTIRIPEGTYEFELEREGYATQLETVKLGYRAQVKLNYELRPIIEPTALHWTLVGVGSAAALAAAGVGTCWVVENQELDNLLEARRNATDESERSELLLEYRRLTPENNNRAVAIWVLGGVGATTLLSAWLLWPSNDVDVSAIPMPGGGAISVQRRF